VKVARYYKLHNQCSGHHIYVSRYHISALAKRDSRHGFMRIETDSTFRSRVTIRTADEPRQYLCFNKAGRLTVKNQSSGKDLSCSFYENMSSTLFTEFQSAKNAMWYIGFNKKGQRLAGDRWAKAKDRNKARKCFQFSKIYYESAEIVDSENGLSLEEKSYPDPKKNYQGPWNFNIDFRSLYARQASIKKNEEV